jgi:competence protein ComEC
MMSLSYCMPGVLFPRIGIVFLFCVKMFGLFCGMKGLGMRCVGAAFVVVGVLSAAAAHAGATDGRLDIYFIDVEGGASTLVATPAGESLLIDSGMQTSDGRDRERVLKVVRQVAGLKRIDHAAVTHWHADHFGNHAALASLIKIGTFWDRGIPDALPADDPQFALHIAPYRMASQNRSKKLRPGDSLPLKSGTTPLSVKVLTGSREVVPNVGPPNEFAATNKPQAEDVTDNAASLSFLLQFGRFKFLVCGDLTWNMEAKLVTPNNPIGKVDLFMVTHHGLPSSNNPTLVLAIDSHVAVMCNGPIKGGAAQTIATLRKVKSLEALYQLHKNLALSAEAQAPPEYIANFESTAQCHGQFIKASVAPDGNSYTVQIGADGKPRTFQVRAD